LKILGLPQIRLAVIATSLFGAACTNPSAPERDGNPNWCAPGVRSDGSEQKLSRIDATVEWNYTGIQISKGASYDITINPRLLEHWSDWFVDATPTNGWQGLAGAFNWLFQGNARYDGAPMYALVCTVGARPSQDGGGSRPLLDNGAPYYWVQVSRYAAAADHRHRSFHLRSH